MSVDLRAQLSKSARALEDLAAKILIAAGAGEHEAITVARYLVMSDLVGHASHGVLRVKQYVEQIQKGEIVCRTQPVVVNEGPGFAVLEGGLGFGQIGAEYATRLACSKAKAQGIALVALRNSAHVGRLGDWVELAAELGCVSFHFVNTLSMPRVAPWGGRDTLKCTMCPPAIGPAAWVKTSGADYFALDPHADDVMHTFVGGPTGNGKTAFVNFLMANFRKTPHDQVFGID